MTILVYNSHSPAITRELFICVQSLYTQTQSKSGIKYRKWLVPTYFKTQENVFKRMYKIYYTSVSRTANFQNYHFFYRYWGINHYRHHKDNFKPYCTHRHLLLLRYPF